MTSRELIRWSARHERRARRWWTSPWVIAIVAGVILHAPVTWRMHESPIAASHAWLALALVAFAVAFMRVPFHLYWRADAALLAQLPIEGGALVDAGLLRCIRAATATTLATVLAAAPLVRVSTRMFLHHAVLACVLGMCAAMLLPAVALWAASLVARGSSGARAARAAYALASGSVKRAVVAPSAPVSSGTVLGALPGFASSIIIVVILVASPWLVDHVTTHEVAPILGPLVAACILAFVATRAAIPKVMGSILRDVSALDRQRLATLEIKPPTAIERAVAAALGTAGLPYRKDARLMRRRYPMAYALGALAFIVLAIVGLARPADPTPWLAATLSGSAAYAIALAGRLYRPPIELPRLSATLPIPPAACARAKLAWIAVWLAIFVAIPAAFALARVT